MTELRVLLEELRGDGLLDRSLNPETREQRWQITATCAGDVSRRAAELIAAKPTTQVRNAVAQAVVESLTAWYRAQNRTITLEGLEERARLAGDIGWLLDHPECKEILDLESIDAWKQDLLAFLLAGTTPEPNAKLIEQTTRRFLQDRLARKPKG